MYGFPGIIAGRGLRAPHVWQILFGKPEPARIELVRQQFNLPPQMRGKLARCNPQAIQVENGNKPDLEVAKYSDPAVRVLYLKCQIRPPGAGGEGSTGSFSPLTLSSFVLPIVNDPPNLLSTSLPPRISLGLEHWLHTENPTCIALVSQ